MLTFPDIIEEIIAEEIVDEFDRYEDNHSKRMAKRKGTAEVMKGYTLCFLSCIVTLTFSLNQMQDCRARKKTRRGRTRCPLGWHWDRARVAAGNGLERDNTVD